MRIIRRDLHVSKDFKKIWVLEYRLANKVNEILGHYHEYRFKAGEEAYFQLSNSELQIQYKRLEDLFSGK